MGGDSTQDFFTGKKERQEQTMDRETARQTIREQWREIIPHLTDPARTRVNGETSWICPFCGHGTNGDGLTYNKKSKDKNGLKCFGCNWTGDIIDLYEKMTDTDYNTALHGLADNIGITIDDYRPDYFYRQPIETAYNAQKPAKMKDSGQDGINYQPNQESPANGLESALNSKSDYLDYYQKCRNRIKEPEAAAYLQSRGISQATAEAYWMGYDPAADPANNPDGAGQSLYPVKRLIIPVSKSYYVARSIDPNTKKQYQKANPKGSAIEIFNSKVLYAQDVQEIFITEGIFDALSVIEAGYAAAALNSASNADALIKQLTDRRTEATLILSLDNDDAGKRATETLKHELQRLNVSYVIANVAGSYKDANEALTSDKDSFLQALEQARHQTAKKPDNTSYYIDALMPAEVERFKHDKKTGFANLDRKAGGLYSGLYVLAAISSLGKTSFALQMADQLAESGEDVIFFSLEQSKLELVSKSIARRTVKTDPTGKPNLTDAVTSLSIRKGYKPDQVQQAINDYKDKIQDRFSIIEANFNCNVTFISDYIREYIRKTGSNPVMFIDYLQILQPAEENKYRSTKESIDATVTELKRLSRELDLTLIVISSVNRQNYLTPIDFESLKESGSIEFSCDVMWGLQLECLNDEIFSKDGKLSEKREMVKKAKAASPRKIELSCLKNRYGIANYSCFFDYYPANDLFIDAGASDEEIKEDEPLKAWKRL